MMLSVIIPGYNTPKKWWTRCLRSVLAALPEDSEVICVDDGSRVRLDLEKIVEDISGSVAKEVKYLYLEKNGGQAAARNKALELARGEYVTFVDSDDELKCDVYAKIIESIAGTDIDVVMFGVESRWAKDGLLRVDCPVTKKLGEISAEDMHELHRLRLFEYPVNKLYKKSFLDMKGIRFDEGLCPGEDTIFNLKCLTRGAKWMTVGTVGYVYYRYDGSSLSRYQAMYRKSEEEKRRLWIEAAETRIGARELWSPYFIPSDGEIDRREWSNLWMRGSPISMIGRFRFAIAHFGMAGGLVLYVKTIVFMFARKWLYVRLVRRWKIKRMFPNVKEMSV